MLLLLYVDLCQSGFRYCVDSIVNGTKSKGQRIMQSVIDSKGMYSLTLSNFIVTPFRSLGEYSFLIRGLKFLLGKGKAFLDSSRSHPVNRYVFILQPKNNNEDLVNYLMRKNDLLKKKNGELQSKIDSLENQDLPNRSEVETSNIGYI